jgi:deoxycytidylate deaminase
VTDDKISGLGQEEILHLPTENSEHSEAYLGHFPNAELVFGICSPLGTKYSRVIESLTNYLEQFQYSVKVIKLSNRFDDLLERLGMDPIVQASRGSQQIETKIQAGNLIREKTKKADILALVASAEIATRRQEEDGTGKRLPLQRTAHIIVSLKRPEEVETLRRLYGAGFFLIGIASSEDHRMQYLVDERGFNRDQVKPLIETDAKETDFWGQRTRDTFFLSDVFVSAAEENGQLRRFIDLVFGHPFNTPTVEERSMYAAYSASFSSGDLARQVGAALVNESNDLLSVGWNDVPKCGGGLYGWDSDARDMDWGYDSNDREKSAMADRISSKLEISENSEDMEKARNSLITALRAAGFFDITEFHRAVHAEMEALLSCARRGSSTRGSTLYVTTFPCHNCTKHMIAAGIEKVFYIEPYAKSKAFELHGDAISANANGGERIPFLPFVGVGPRRYLDLFSLTLGTGHPVERKANGKKAPWDRAAAAPRLQMQPISYLDRETLAMSRLNELLSRATVSQSPCQR